MGTETLVRPLNAPLLQTRIEEEVGESSSFKFSLRTLTKNSNKSLQGKISRERDWKTIRGERAMNSSRKSNKARKKWLSTTVYKGVTISLKKGKKKKQRKREKKGTMLTVL